MAVVRFGKIMALSGAMLFAAMAVAEAAVTPSAGVLLSGGGRAGAGDGTLGGVMLSTAKSFASLPHALSAFAYILGLYFIITGIFKFKGHVENPVQVPLSDGVKRFMAGGLMLSGPYVASALHATLFGNGQGGKFGARLPSGGGSGELDQMIVNFIMNIKAPMESLLSIFVYVSAIALLVVGINRLTKTAQEGPRGPAGFGTLMTFLAAGALFSFGDMIGAFSASVFGGSAVTSYANISTSVISTAEDAKRIGAVIQAIMVFIMIVGYIAFVRGWFVLKAFADGGNPNASIAQALTFLFGGVLAINLGQLVNILQKTVGVSGITFG